MYRQLAERAVKDKMGAKIYEVAFVNCHSQIKYLVSYGKENIRIFVTFFEAPKKQFVFEWQLFFTAFTANANYI